MYSELTDMGASGTAASFRLTKEGAYPNKQSTPDATTPHVALSLAGRTLRAASVPCHDH